MVEHGTQQRHTEQQDHHCPLWLLQGEEGHSDDHHRHHHVGLMEYFHQGADVDGTQFSVDTAGGRGLTIEAARARKQQRQWRLEHLAPFQQQHPHSPVSLFPVPDPGVTKELMGYEQLERVIRSLRTPGGSTLPESSFAADTTTTTTTTATQEQVTLSQQGRRRQRGQAPEDGPKKRRRSGTNRKQHTCGNCRVTEAPMWRRGGEDGQQILCNKCGLYWARHGRHRPDVIRRGAAAQTSRERNRQQSATAQEARPQSQHSRSSSNSSGTSSCVHDLCNMLLLSPSCANTLAEVVSIMHQHQQESSSAEQQQEQEHHHHQDITEFVNGEMQVSVNQNHHHRISRAMSSVASLSPCDDDDTMPPIDLANAVQAADSADTTQGLDDMLRHLLDRITDGGQGHEVDGTIEQSDDCDE